MEYEKIKELITDVGNSNLTSIDIEFPDGIKIKMEKKNETVVVKANESVQKNISETIVTKEINSENIEKKEEITEVEKEGKIITSPMIGTFYAKPSPDSKPFVEVGSTISKGDTVCIIEAMKLMNEIESEFSGKIVEVLVNNGEMVDYGKPLFRVV